VGIAHAFFIQPETTLKVVKIKDQNPPRRWIADEATKNKDQRLKTRLNGGSPMRRPKIKNKNER